jgi:hypothetical protein
MVPAPHRLLWRQALGPHWPSRGAVSRTARTGLGGLVEQSNFWDCPIGAFDMGLAPSLPLMGARRCPGVAPQFLQLTHPCGDLDSGPPRRDAHHLVSMRLPPR